MQTAQSIQIIWNPDTYGSIDHRSVKAPYLRLEHFWDTPKGDVIYKYDLRLTQPNSEYIPGDALHSLEHFLLVSLRTSMPSFLGVAPMGCQTGFYLFLLNEGNFDTIAEHLFKAFDDVMTAGEVPLSDVKCCGHAAYHTLSGSQEIIKKVRNSKKDWRQVFW